MARGKTVSITLPLIVLDHYEKKAKQLGVSRSATLVGVLIKEYQEELRAANVITHNTQTEEL